MTFQRAQRSQVYLKLAITGVTGSGKTFSALRLATGLTESTGKRIAVLDTENNSASLYSDKFDFDVLPIAPPFNPSDFAEGTRLAAEMGYGALIIDSASHLWKGILTYKSQIDERGGNQYTNWKEPDKKFNEALDAVLQSKIHAIFCMRSKMEYVMEDNGKGKQAPRRVGLAPIMREGIEFEFTTVFDIAQNHEAVSSKDRSGLFPNDRYFIITEQTGIDVGNWLKTATPQQDSPTPTPEAKPKAPAMSEDEEHAKRVAGRRSAAATEKPESMPDEVWENLYLATLVEVLDLLPKTVLAELSIPELKEASAKHKQIMKRMADEMALLKANA